MKQIVKKTLSTIVFPFFAAKEKSSKEGSIRVLIYHSIDKRDRADVLGLRIDPAIFRMQMQRIRDLGYEVLDINDIFTKLNKPRNRYLVLTFDDGYKDFILNALPILREFNYPAALFVNVRYLQGVGLASKSGYWENWQKMSWDDLKEVGRESKITIANHGLSHKRPTKLNHAELVKEIVYSKNIIEQKLGRKIELFAYPHGDFSEGSKRVLREAGYRAAFTGKIGKLDYREDVYELRRTDIGCTNNSGFEFLKKLNGSYDWLGKIPRYAKD